MLRRITRLKVTLFVLIVALILLLIYTWSAESPRRKYGNPKAMNEALLDQEIENARLIILIDSLQKENHNAHEPEAANEAPS